jgi:hypothetical protein
MRLQEKYAEYLKIQEAPIEIEAPLAVSCVHRLLC